MKHFTLFLRPLAPLVCAAAFLPADARAQSAAAGYLTFTLPATTATTTSYLSAPLQTDAVFTGNATSVGDQTITATTETWTTAAFAGTTPYYVQVKSGSEIGRVLRILANTTTALTVDVTDNTAQSTNLTTSGFALSTSDTIEIISGYTLGSFFGPTAAQQVLTGGADSDAADNVSLWNWQLGRFDTYYFNTTQNAWLSTTGVVSTNTALPPGATLAVTRKAGRAQVQFIQLGRVPTVTPLLKNPGGNFTSYSGLRVPVDMTFSQIVLGSNWVKSNSAFTADTLSVFNATAGKWDAYYQRTDLGWRKSGSATSQDATVIPAGSAVAFTKRAAVTGSASFHPLTLSYTP